MSNVIKSGCCSNVDTICCKNGERLQFKISTINGDNLDACGLDQSGQFWGFKHYNDILCNQAQQSNLFNNTPTLGPGEPSTPGPELATATKRMAPGTWCATIEQPPAGMNRAVFQKSLVWTKERRQEDGVMVLRVGFVEGSPEWKKRWIEKVVKEKLQSLIAVDFLFFFEYDASSNLDILIGFNPGYANSALGKTSQQLARFGNQSMNLGWLDNPIKFTGINGKEYQVPQENLGEYLQFSGNFIEGGVVIHEFGHALGMIHEHQSPSSTLEFNKNELYDYMAQAPNCWTKDIVDSNIIERFDKESELYDYSQFDKNSIMIYPMFGWWTRSCINIPFSGSLSKLDAIWLQKNYNPREGKEVKFCDTDTCGEGGQCIESLHICECLDGWKGSRCDIPPEDPCMGVVCQNGGFCGEGGKCQCKFGSTGDNCEIIENWCTDVDCGEGGGQCGERGVCVCPFGKGGPQCEQDEVDDFCKEAGCPLGCEGRGVCVCPPGFGGPRCEKSACDFLFCERGFCTVQPDTGKAECICPPGFSGPKCEEKVTNDCGPTGCGSGGLCSNGVCICFSGWKGEKCNEKQPQEDKGNDTNHIAEDWLLVAIKRWWWVVLVLVLVAVAIKRWWRWRLRGGGGGD